MIIPYGYQPTESERQERKLKSSIQKATHLAQRVRLFLEDIEKSDMKKSDKIKIKAILNPIL